MRNLLTRILHDLIGHQLEIGSFYARCCGCRRVYVIEKNFALTEVSAQRREYLFGVPLEEL